MVVACQSQGSDDYVRNLICLVQNLYRGSEGFEVRDGRVRE
jgi:hypothetical protein